jgi:uncharacterized protein
MRLSLLLAAILLATSPMAGAQPASASTPAKKELVQKILSLQQPAIEAMARQLVEAPAGRMLQQAGPVLQQKIAADKREAVAQEIQADVQKYVEESIPVVRDRAVKLGPTTIGALLEERFTEDELKQVIVLLESPVNKKFNAMAPEMQRALGEKLVADTRATIEPKMQALQDSVAKRLGVTARPPAGAASGAKKK